MQRLKRLKQSILACTQGQVNGHINQVDTKELGQAIDMIKDLEQAMYYCTIVQAMEKQDKQQPNSTYYYTPMRKPQQYWPDERYQDMMERQQWRRQGKMYYDGPNGGRNMGNSTNSGNMENANSGNGGTNYYDHNPRYVDPYMKNIEPYYPPRQAHDYRQGNSPIQRKMYMQGKQTHKKKQEQMKELQKYMQELSKDVTQMIQGASTEQKQMLQQKLVALSKMVVA